MGRIISSYIFPHPPIIVPEVGKGGEEGAAKTLDAVKRAAQLISKEKPTTIIVTTPHGPVFQDYIYVSTSEKLRGDLSQFRAGEVRLEFTNNIELVNKIISYAKAENIYAGGLDDSIARKYNVSRELDHGALVPLYFVNQGMGNFKLVHISIAGLPFEDLYKFGICISKAIDETDEQVVFISSGDLSHRLSHDAPYGYSERGKEFDELLVESIKRYDVKRLLQIDEGLCESAGECGLRSFIIMFGALDSYKAQSEVLSYEGPFGVGYAVARFDITGRDNGKNILKEVEKSNMDKVAEIRDNEDVYVKLARSSLEHYVKGNGIISVPEELPREMLEQKAGTFVSIKKNGRLRGCIGTIAPTRKNTAEEIIYNAISAGTKDPRFDPIQEEELDQLVYSVDVLKEPEPIDSIDQLDVVKYGVIVRSGMRSGLLLPNLEGIDTPEEQVKIALQKAGIRPDEQYTMERFEVIRHK